MIEVARGHRIEQDESGRIVKSELSPERAREIGSGPHGAKEKRANAKALADSILQSMRNPDDAAARDEARERLVRAAAAIAAREGTQAMAAVQALASSIREAFTYRPSVTLPPYKPGETCPHCGQGGNLAMTEAGLAYLRDLVRRNAEMLLAEHA